MLRPSSAVLLLAVTLLACRTRPFEASPTARLEDGGAADLTSLDGAVDGAIDAAVDANRCQSSTEPSRQTVTFRLRNLSTGDRWVAANGQWCDAFSIDGISRTLGFQCHCECPNPGGSHVERFRRLHPTELFELSWDARALSTCNQSVDCPGPPARSANELIPSFTQVAAGAYQATFGVESTAPPGCTANGNFVDCGMSGNGFSLPPPIQTRCQTSQTVSAAFTLPASGDVMVEVAIQ